VLFYSSSQSQGIPPVNVIIVYIVITVKAVQLNGHAGFRGVKTGKLADFRPTPVLFSQFLRFQWVQHSHDFFRA
jgi:hypothetical protein